MFESCVTCQQCNSRKPAKVRYGQGPKFQGPSEHLLRNCPQLLQYKRPEYALVIVCLFSEGVKTSPWQKATFFIVAKKLPDFLFSLLGIKTFQSSTQAPVSQETLLKNSLGHYP